MASRRRWTTAHGAAATSRHPAGSRQSFLHCAAKEQKVDMNSLLIKNFAVLARKWIQLGPPGPGRVWEWGRSGICFAGLQALPTTTIKIAKPWA